MEKYLKKAHLEELGFKKILKRTVETDEHGRTTVKKVVRYVVQDDCSNATFWEEKLRERLPKKVIPDWIVEKILHDLEERIVNYTPKYCDIGFDLPHYECSTVPSCYRKRAIRFPVIIIVCIHLP